MISIAAAYDMLHGFKVPLPLVARICRRLPISTAVLVGSELLRVVLTPFCQSRRISHSNKPQRAVTHRSVWQDLKHGAARQDGSGCHRGHAAGTRQVNLIPVTHETRNYLLLRRHGESNDELGRCVPTNRLVPRCHRDPLHCKRDTAGTVAAPATAPRMRVDAALVFL